MKIYAMLIIVLLAISGCSTSYKGSIKGSNEEGSKSAKDVASQSKDIQAKP
jgi:PBP1b-binding outer membrane lipoprotein LpoB